MAHEDRTPRHPWNRKIVWAVRGALWGISSQRGNFAIHLTTAAAVVLAGFWLHVSLLEWCLLVLCIATVLAAELFNTALEQLARAITREHQRECSQCTRRWGRGRADRCQGSRDRGRDHLHQSAGLAVRLVGLSPVQTRVPRQSRG